MKKTTPNPTNETKNLKGKGPSKRLEADQNYENLVRQILRRNKYDFFITISFRYWRPDNVIVQSTSHLLKVLNRSLSGRSWKGKGRYLEGYAFLERHAKDNDREGSFHVHMIGYFPETFSYVPTDEQFEWKVKEASMKVTSPNRAIITKPKKPNKKQKKVISERGESMISIGEVDVQVPYDMEGLVRYLSKELTPENLDERVMLLGKEGLIGRQPDTGKSENHYRSNDLYNSKFEISKSKTIYDSRK